MDFFFVVFFVDYKKEKVFVKYFVRYFNVLFGNFCVVFIIYGNRVVEVVGFDFNWFFLNFEVVVDRVLFVGGDRWIDWFFDKIF